MHVLVLLVSSFSRCASETVTVPCICTCVCVCLCVRVGVCCCVRATADRCGSAANVLLLFFPSFWLLLPVDDSYTSLLWKCVHMYIRKIFSMQNMAARCVGGRQKDFRTRHEQRTKAFCEKKKQAHTHTHKPNNSCLEMHGL